MNEFIDHSDLPEFDATEHLRSPRAVAAFLNSILEEKNAELTASALSDIARADALSEYISKTSAPRDGLTQDTQLPNSLEFDAVLKMLAAKGVELVARPIPHKRLQPAKHD